MNVPIREANIPAPYMPSIYANHCEKHYYEMDDCVSVKVTDLFPSMTPAIYNHGDDIQKIVDATRESLKNVDMSMIKPEDTVNICCSEHGFTLMGGEPYTVMIKTIKDVVEERTNNYNIRLRLCMHRTPAEAREVIDYFHLKERFDCEIIGSGPFDEGIEIDTYLGPVYGIKRVFDADWCIYAYYDDPREMYVHRAQRRTFKSFMMNFSRYETRSAVHFTCGPRDLMLVPQAVYDSEFVQSKWAFNTLLLTSPAGVCQIMSSNDLYEIDRQSQINMTKNYEMIRRLFGKTKPYIAILDGGRWGYYLHTGGMVFGCMDLTNYDFFNLDEFSAQDFHEIFRDYDGGLLAPTVASNHTLAAIVGNQQWTGLNITTPFSHNPTWLVGEEQVEMFRNDSTNQGFGPGTGVADITTKVDTLEEGIAEAIKATGVSRIVAFDGSFGSINCNREAAEDIIRAAEGIEEEVLTEAWPKLLRQRGIDPDEVIGK